jgi:hypothetical protein
MTWSTSRPNGAMPVVSALWPNTRARAVTSLRPGSPEWQWWSGPPRFSGWPLATGHGRRSRRDVCARGTSGDRSTANFAAALAGCGADLVVARCGSDLARAGELAGALVDGNIIQSGVPVPSSSMSMRPWLSGFGPIPLPWV